MYNFIWTIYSLILNCIFSLPGGTESSPLVSQPQDTGLDLIGKFSVKQTENKYFALPNDAKYCNVVKLTLFEEEGGTILSYIQKLYP